MRKVIAILLCLCQTSWAAFAIVEEQAEHEVGCASSTTQTLTYATPPTVGNLLVILARNRTNASNMSLTDNGSNTYTQIGSQHSTASGDNQAAFYSVIGTQPTTITVTYVTAVTGVTLQIYEFSGNAPAGSVFDAEVDALQAAAKPYVSTTLTTTNANDLILMGAGVPNDMTTPFWTAQSGFTIPNNTGVGSDAACPQTMHANTGTTVRTAWEYQFVSAPWNATITLTNQVSTAGAWWAVGFKQAASGSAAGVSKTSRMERYE